MAPIRRCRACVICRTRYSRLNGIKRKFMANFPLNEDRCRQWVQAIGNEDLVYIPIEKLHQIKYVCGDHFQPHDFNRKKTRLRKWAVPSLLLKAPPLPNHMLAEFPCHIATSEESNKISISSKIVKLADIEENSSLDQRYARTGLRLEHNYCRTVQSEIMKYIANFDATDNEDPLCEVKQESCDEDDPLALETPRRKRKFHILVKKISRNHSEETCIVEPDTTVRESMVPENMDSDSGIPENMDSDSGVLENIESISKAPETMKNSAEPEIQTRSLSPIATMYEDLKKTRRKLKNAMARLKAKKKVDKVQFLDNALSGMNEVGKHILLMQVRFLKKKNRGIRFSEADKALSLLIFKQKPEVYKFLRSIFILPSIRTLQAMCVGPANGEPAADLPANSGEYGEHFPENDGDHHETIKTTTIIGSRYGRVGSHILKKKNENKKRPLVKRLEQKLEMNRANLIVP